MNGKSARRSRKTKEHMYLENVVSRIQGILDDVLDDGKNFLKYAVEERLPFDCSMLYSSGKIHFPALLPCSGFELFLETDLHLV